MILAIIISFIIVITTIYYFSLRERVKRWKTFMKLPGDKGYPLIGHLLEFCSKTPELIFQDERSRCTTHYPIFKVWSLSIGMIKIVSPDDIELVLSNTKHISKSNTYNFLHNWLGLGLLTSTGSKWQYRRKLLTPAFHFNILQEFISIFNNETKTLVKTLEKECHKPYIDVKGPITEFTLVSIAETAMGIDLNSSENKEQMQYKQAIYEMGKIIVYRLLTPWFHNDAIYKLSGKSRVEKKLVKQLHNFTNNVISSHKEAFNNKKNGTINESYSTKKKMAMLDLLLSYKEQGADISDEGIREEVETFMFEGHDTTSLALCYILLVMANEPQHQEEVYNEIIENIPEGKDPDMNDLNKLKFMERCIKESLRLYPSVPNIGRSSGEEIITKSGYIIPKGYDMMLHIFDMHRSPAVWPNPEKFDPDRFLPENTRDRHPFAYIPFSAGSRNCIGQKFAILELKAALCGVLRNFKLEAVDTLNNIVFIPDIVLRSKGPIRVKFIKRNK